MVSAQQCTMSKRLGLLDLPLEIRETIYKYLFSTTVIFPKVRGSGSTDDKLPRVHPILNFLLASRQICSEVKPAFWRNCLFDLSAPIPIHGGGERHTRKLASGSGTIVFHKDHCPSLSKEQEQTPHPFVEFEHLHQMRRIYCNSTFARCLNPEFKHSPRWKKRIFPYMDKTKMKIHEMTIEIRLHMRDALTNNEWSWGQLIGSIHEEIPNIAYLRMLKDRTMKGLRYVRVVDGAQEGWPYPPKPGRAALTLDADFHVSDVKNMTKEDAKRFAEHLLRMLEIDFVHAVEDLFALFEMLTAADNQ